MLKARATHTPATDPVAIAASPAAALMIVPLPIASSSFITAARTRWHRRARMLVPTRHEHRSGLLHALAHPSQSSSRLSAIRSLAIRIALSAGKMGASRKRNDSATKRLPYPALVAFGRDSDTRRVAGRHPDAGRLSGDIRTHHALSGDFWTLKRLRASESCPRTLVMSENRPRIPRRPDVARTSSGVRTPPGKCSAITITL